MQIKYENLSAKDWKRVETDWTQDAYTTLGTSPGDVLKAGSFQTLSFSQLFLSKFANGGMDMSCMWWEEETRQAFNVKIHDPVQVIGIGKAPYWYVWYARFAPGHSPWTINQDAYAVITGHPIPFIEEIMDWNRPNDKATSMPYTFSQMQKFDVTATPSASHSNLSIEVQITTKR